VTSALRFARRVYLVAGIYGLLVLVPQYFLIEKNGRDFPPAITHLEYYYGFVGVAIAWQLGFLIIAGDPRRFRPIMPATVVEKFIFGVPATAMFLAGTLSASMMGAAVLDMLLGTLFLTAYLRTGADAGV
jgi:hypothetical protein